MTNRPIKFCFWDSGRECLTYSSEYERLDQFFERYVFFGEDGKIDQFSGLLDKNGREIYEGDILYCRDGEKTFYATVYYDAPSFRAKSDLSRNDILIWFDLYEQCSVCGNIHENPELLK